jgi:hypothetical protein
VAGSRRQNCGGNQRGVDQFAGDDRRHSRWVTIKLTVAEQGQDTLMPGLSRIRVPALVQGVISRSEGQEEIKERDEEAERPPGNRSL